MVRIIDLDSGGLTAEQVQDSVRSPEGAILRRGGRVIARLEAADETDLDDENWAHAPEQVARGEAARQRFREGRSLSSEAVRRILDAEDPG